MAVDPNLIKAVALTDGEIDVVESHPLLPPQNEAAVAMTKDEIYVVVRPWLARVLAVFQKIGRMSEQVSEANKVGPTTNELLALSINASIDLPDRWHEVWEAVISGNGNRILECVDCIIKVRERWHRDMPYGYFNFDILRLEQDTFNNCIDRMRQLDIKPDVQWLDDVIQSIPGDIDRKFYDPTFQSESPPREFDEVHGSRAAIHPNPGLEIASKPIPSQGKTPRVSTNTLMIELLQVKPEAKGYSIREWSVAIKRSISAIQVTKIWQNLRTLAEFNKIERLDRQTNGTGPKANEKGRRKRN